MEMTLAVENAPPAAETMQEVGAAAMTGAQYAVTLASFLAFMAAVAVITWLMTRKERLDSEDGFFLAGRNLTFPFIAGSLLLTNLSTEQLVGLNADAFDVGLHVMAWEVMAVVALVAMALFFLPRFLRSGITTVPEMLQIRYNSAARTVCNLIFLVAYATILLPLVLYSGAQGLIGILDLRQLTGIENPTALLWVVVVGIGFVGSCYALFGGLRSVAVSDTLVGICLLTGGFLIPYFGLKYLGSAELGGDGSLMDGFRKIMALNQQGMDAGDISRLNSIGPEATVVAAHNMDPHMVNVSGRPPFSTLFTGVLIINLFYWCTNQQIIQRTLAAKSLSEGQKGVLLTGLLKLLGPMYLVLPGIIAFFMVRAGALDINVKVDPHLNSEVYVATEAYGALVRKVLPTALTGFFAAAMVGGHFVIV